MAPLSVPYRIQFVSGALLVLAPAVVAQAVAIHGPAIAVRSWVGGLALVCAILLGTAGLVLPHAGRSGRVLASLGVFAGAAVATPMLRRSPGLTLLFVLALLTVTLLLARDTPPGVAAFRAALQYGWRARGAATTSTVAWLFVAATPRRFTPLEGMALSVGSIIAIVLIARWAAGKDVSRTQRLILGFGGRQASFVVSVRQQ
jgi:hypothetical protein